jgi:2-amino-4-hydroxy-6-hydroxymethyldihydropteridine diphosphokinase
MMRNETTVYCLLGSNLGERMTLLKRAAFALAGAEGVEIVRASSVYETAPWGKTDQPAYLNAVLELKTSLAPLDLLDCCQDIERRLGRVRGPERWAERVIDLDILLYGREVIRSERLVVPHEHLHDRAFALVPLLEIASDLRDPASNRLYAEVLRSLDSQGTREGSSDQTSSASDNASATAPTGVSSGISPLIAKAESIAGPVFESAFLALSDSPEETEEFAEAFAAELKGGEVVALAGNLGAGKTCFARGLARGLGIPGPITSPSYVLVKSYEGRLTLHHADFYRLGGAGAHEGRSPEPPDLASLGLEDYLDNPAAVVLIEWADRYPQWLEPPFWLVEITGAGMGPRLLLVRRIERQP